MAQPILNLESEFNAARQCLSHGKLDEAERILTRLKAVMAPHPILFEYLGFIALQRQELKKAARHYKKAAKLDPSNLDVKMKLAEVLLAAGEETEAVRLAQAVHRKDPLNVSALNVLGMTAAQTGDRAQARAFFASAVDAEPKSFQSWHSLGRLLLGMGLWDEALDALLKADALRPDHWQTLTYIGRVLTSLGQPEAAFERLLHAQTLVTTIADYCEASIHLAEAYRRAQHLDKAIEVLDVIEAQAPGYLRASAVRATILHEQGHNDKALEVVRLLCKNEDSVGAEWFPNYLEGQCLLSLARHDEAATAFDLANRQQTAIFERSGANKDIFIQYAREAQDLYSRSEAISIASAKSSNAGSHLAFINGFPRSGTTLIDAILRTHSNVAVAEESNAAHHCWQQAIALIPGGLANLGALDDTIAERLRQHYFDHLSPDLSAERHGRKVVDRHATGLLQAGLMKHLFPGAQFFLMLRHPCDVVLSAWFANFQPTDHTANYLTIEDTARFYDQIMTLHTTLEDSMGINSQVIRYEDIVTDLRSTVEPVLQVMGLAWEDQLESFHSSQHRPKKTASFNQIAKPLYKTATYRFEHYQSTLKPVMPILEPWVERFGYR